MENIHANPVGIIRNKREFSEKEILEINDLLLNTKLSYREIGRRYEVSHGIIIQIKNGSIKKYRIKGKTYPLRPNNPVSTILAKRSTTTIDT